MSLAQSLGKGADERKHEFDDIEPAFVESSKCFVTMTAMPRDTLDRNLLALLQANARDSTANLARKLGVARTTVLARLARLERERVIVGYTVRLSPGEADRTVQAYVGIVTDPKKVRSVTQRLARLPELSQLSSVSGEFDYIALLRADSTARLDTLLDEIGQIDGVSRTTTSVVLALRIDRTTQP